MYTNRPHINQVNKLDKRWLQLSRSTWNRIRISVVAIALAIRMMWHRPKSAEKYRINDQRKMRKMKKKKKKLNNPE